MRKLGELRIGDRLYEGAGKYLSRAGRLIAVMKHPLKEGVLFLLAIQQDNQLTLYQGPASGPYISLARHIPANVFCEFCGVVNAGISIHDDADANDPPDSYCGCCGCSPCQCSGPTAVVTISADPPAAPKAAEPVDAYCGWKYCLLDFRGIGPFIAEPPITTGG